MPKQKREEWYMFDYIIQNSDRHDGNWMISSNKKEFFLIDNGLALSEANLQTLRPLYQGMYFNEEVIDKTLVKKLRAFKRKQKSVSKNLEKIGLDPQAIYWMWERVDYLLETGKHVRGSAF